MTNYLEYQLDDEITILVETDEEEPAGVTKASRDEAGNVIASVNQRFDQAFSAMKKSALVLRQQFIEMQADEVTVTFGLKAAGEAGNFVIGKAGMEANYTVTLTWNHAAEKEAQPEQNRRRNR